MIANPKPGMRVQIWYRAELQEHMPWHGHCGAVEIVGRGKPRNHGVRLDNGKLVAFPCGNLRKPS
jgi:hypothetical protein